MKETDLHEPLFSYFSLQGYKVDCEVLHVDMVLHRDEDLIAIELKNNLNLDVVSQACQRQKSFDSVYVAVRNPSFDTRQKGKWKNALYVLKRLGLGLILVSPPKSPKKHENEFGLVEIMHHPSDYQPRQNQRARTAIIREISGRTFNYNQAGSQKTKLMTAYREKAVHIACALQQLGNASPSQLRKLGTASNTQAILQNNLYGWFERESRGVYVLHSAGEQALRDFPELVDHYNGELGKVVGDG